MYFGWRRLPFFRRSDGPGDCGQLRAEEVNFTFEAIGGIPSATERVAGTVPNDYERNCKNNDQKEFHKQLLGL